MASSLSKLSPDFNLKEPYCQLCKHWRDLQKSSGRKFCHIQEKVVEAESPACEKLEVNDMFWCYKNGQYRAVGSCIKRQGDIGEESYLYERGCMKCKQGKVIQNAWKRTKINKVKKLRDRRKK